MIRHPPRSTRTDTLFPYTTLFRSVAANLRGTLFNGWAGPILVAVGAEYRTNASKGNNDPRSEEHTSELQSLMRISYAVFCLKKKKQENQRIVSNRQTYQKIIDHTTSPSINLTNQLLHYNEKI